MCEHNMHVTYISVYFTAELSHYIRWRIPSVGDKFLFCSSKFMLTNTWRHWALSVKRTTLSGRGLVAEWGRKRTSVASWAVLKKLNCMTSFIQKNVDCCWWDLRSRCTAFISQLVYHFDCKKYTTCRLAADHVPKTLNRNAKNIANVSPSPHHKKNACTFRTHKSASTLHPQTHQSITYRVFKMAAHAIRPS